MVRQVICDHCKEVIKRVPHDFQAHDGNPKVDQHWKVQMGNCMVRMDLCAPCLTELKGILQDFKGGPR